MFSAIADDLDFRVYAKTASRVLVKDIAGVRRQTCLDLLVE
jgi:hypothetical protein